MDSDSKIALWHQFGASLDMFENAVRTCPEALWGDRSRTPEIWYMAYHTLFFLDYYLSRSPEGFAPPSPFTLGELDPAGVLPDRVYTRAELLDYLQHGREKCRLRIRDLGEAEARRRAGFGSFAGSTHELLLYNMRHVQHHTAQLNLLLRQAVDDAPGWVGRTKRMLDE